MVETLPVEQGCSRNINITTTNNSVIVDANGKITTLTSCKKYSAREIVGKFTSVSMHRRFKKADIKEAYIQAGDELGCAVGQVAKMLNGAINRAFIAPNYTIIKRFGYVKGFLDCCRTNDVIKAKHVFQQYFEDNNQHLAGFTLVWGDAAASKHVCGKGLWKSLCHNSKTRNDLICEELRTVHPNDRQKACAYLQTIPSTLLKLPEIGLHYRLGVSFPSMLIKAMDKPLYKITSNDVNQVSNIIKDCVRMLGDRFNSSWSFKRIEREHRLASKRLHERQYTDNDFPYYDKLPHTITNKGFTAKLVRSPRQLFDVGAEQHHCVGSYHIDCWIGEYIVYQISDALGNKTSTLGFDSRSDGPTHASQHYHAWNVVVEDIEQIEFAHFVEKHIKDLSLNLVIPQEQPTYLSPVPVAIPIARPVAPQAIIVEQADQEDYLTRVICNLL